MDGDEVGMVVFLSILLLGARCTGHKDDMYLNMSFCRRVSRSLLYCRRCVDFAM